ncbi:MAG: NADH-quinone oxidoreductase subunit J [Actinocrinis sp.]
MSAPALLLANQAVLAAPVTATGHGEAFLFWLGSIVSVLGALGLIFSKKAVHSALCLCAVMICLALFYMAQGAVFLGIVQIVVYTGAIMMLFLFVLMLIGVDAAESLTETIRGQRWAGVLVAALFAAIMIGVFAHAHLGVFAGVDAANAQAGGNVPSLAHLLFAKYYWAFEVSSAVLITSALGAMVLAHRERVTARKTQKEMAADRFKRFGKDPSAIVTPLPSPGVYAQHNAVDTPALLPDGSISELSVNATLRARVAPRDIRPLPVPLPRVGANGNGDGHGPSAGDHEEVEA